MASGKTTTGKKVAQKIGLPFIDLDEEILKTTQKSINEIFNEKGEAGFREIEHKIFENVLNNLKTHSIIASGGGLLTYEKNLNLTKDRCITIFLDMPWQLIKERLLEDQSRPLLLNKSTLEIHALWQKRRKLYLKHANYIIKVTSTNYGNSEKLK